MRNDKHLSDLAANLSDGTFPDLYYHVVAPDTLKRDIDKLRENTTEIQYNDRPRRGNTSYILQYYQQVHQRSKATFV